VGIKIVECASDTELYGHYPGQHTRQECYIQVSLRDGTVWADYNAETSNAVPIEVHQGFDRRYGIPLLTGQTANALLAEIAPLAERMCSDWESVWDGNNSMAVLGPQGTVAEAELCSRLGWDADGLGGDPNQGFDESDLVQVWYVESCTDGTEADHYGITPATTDDELARIAESIRTNLKASDHDVVVCPGLFEYLAAERRGN